MTFDLEAARRICDKASFKLTGAEIDEDLKILVDQAAMLPAALDDIERLQADRENLAGRLNSAECQIIQYDEMAAKFREEYDAQAKRIAELELILSQSKQVIDGLQKTDAELREESQKRYERIAELEAELRYEFKDGDRGLIRVILHGEPHSREQRIRAFNAAGFIFRHSEKQRAAIKKLGAWYCILRNMLRDPDIDYKLSQNPDYVSEQLRQE